MLRNRFDGTIIKCKGKVVSAKENDGLGLRSIEAVVERYDGELTTEWDEDTFTASVTMKL